MRLRNDDDDQSLRLVLFTMQIMYGNVFLCVLFDGYDSPWLYFFLERSVLQGFYLACVAGCMMIPSGGCII